MVIGWRGIVLAATTLYQLVSCALESRQAQPGQLVDLDGRPFHWLERGERSHAQAPVIVVAHSLGGVEGYLLMDDLAQLGQTVIYDRAGYGWSGVSKKAATVEAAIADLDAALTKAEIAPPYLLVGDSLGSYHMRLYAHRYPEKVAGLVLTDGLHEAEMLRMPGLIQLLKLLFWAGFVIATLGSALGIVRLLQRLGAFEWFKPELRQFSKGQLAPIKLSMARPKHWFTMAREIWRIDQSGRQLKAAVFEQEQVAPGEHPLGDLPIVSIKSKTFFHRAWWTFVIPLRQIDQLRDRIHTCLAQLSSNCRVLEASASSHFVWTDEPEVMVKAVRLLLESLG